LSLALQKETGDQRYWTIIGQLRETGGAPEFFRRSLGCFYIEVAFSVDVRVPSSALIESHDSI
jgi:hypothetical protein